MGLIEELEKILASCESMDTAKKIKSIILNMKLLSEYMAQKDQTEGGNRDYRAFPKVLSQLSIVVSLFKSVLPDYEKIFTREIERSLKGGFQHKDIISFLEHFVDLVRIFVFEEKEMQSGNVYLGIEEKLQRAHKSIRERNYEGLFSNLHTIIELLLKDKLGIALSMDDVRLGRVIGACINDNVFGDKNNILSELDKKVCKIDNAIKHKSYNPTATEINESLLITEQAVRVLKEVTPKIGPEVKEKISGLLI